MTEQELQEEAGILDKACRQCGAELAQGGINALMQHFTHISAIVAKLKRLEADKASQALVSHPVQPQPEAN